MVHELHNPSLLIDISVFGTTLGCINLALLQWFRSRKRMVRDKKEHRKDEG
jgi:hypothetical protein